MSFPYTTKSLGREEAKRLDWIRYDPTGDLSSYVEPARWGKDHWSTLAYAESCTVNYAGVLDNQRIRCDPRLHRHFAASHHLQSDKKYPTRLADGELEKHDDWSCLEDAAAFGLLVLESADRRPHEAFGNMVARVRLTPMGMRIASDLRRAIAEGTSTSMYRYSPTLRNRIDEILNRIERWMDARDIDLIFPLR